MVRTGILPERSHTHERESARARECERRGRLYTHERETARAREREREEAE